MEKRTAKLIVGTPGGTAGNGAKTYKISLPTKWINEMNISDKQMVLFFDGEKIIIASQMSFQEFITRKKELHHKILLLRFYDKNDLCTEIAADFTDKTIAVQNYTDNIIKTAFGNNKNPDWNDFEAFLADRCIPESRSGLREYLEAIDEVKYAPLQIIQKTKGKMAEDQQWIETEEVK